jgi:hypothetical protein
VANRGRPPKYKPKVAAIICERIAGGETLNAICESDKSLPPASTIRTWLYTDIDPEFSAQFARAKELQAHSLHDQTLQIADTPRESVRRVDNFEVIWECPTCERQCRWYSNNWIHCDDRTVICAGVSKPIKKKVLIGTELIQADGIDRARLMIDVRQRYISRTFPQVYGDRKDRENDAEKNANKIKELMEAFPVLPPPPDWTSPEQLEQEEKEQAGEVSPLVEEKGVA